MLALGGRNWLCMRRYASSPMICLKSTFESLKWRYAKNVSVKTIPCIEVPKRNLKECVIRRFSIARMNCRYRLCLRNR